MDQDETWLGGRPRPRPHCVRWGPSSPSPKRGHSSPPPLFGPCLLLPNGWMDQDATWYGGRPLPRPHCVRRQPSFLPHSTAASHFSAHVYCDQTAGWIKIPLGTGRPQPRRYCVRWGTQLPLRKVHSPHFSAHIYCVQMAGWIKMPLGMELGLSQGHIVLDGDLAPPKRGAVPPDFRPVYIVAKGSTISATAEHFYY